MEASTFLPHQHDDILQFFKDHNYVVIEDALSEEEVSTLNAFVDSSQREIPEEWGVGGKMPGHGQILVEHPELDRHVQPPRSYPIVEAILGEGVRFAQFDFREAPPETAGDCAMDFHRDRRKVALNRRKESPFECAYLCAIYYLWDVHDCCPCFCVMPNSHRYETKEEARAQMTNYQEVPIRGKAGTGILYNIDIFHARVTGVDACTHGRRTQHTYYSHVTNPPLTYWMLVPERLARHPDAATREFYSQWTEDMAEHAAVHFPRSR